MGKYKRNSKKKITKIVEYKKENGILTKNYPIFETEEEIEAYLIHIRKQHDREAEYIADSLGLIY